MHLDSIGCQLPEEAGERNLWARYFKYVRTEPPFYEELRLKPFLDQWAKQQGYGKWQIYIAQGAPLRIPEVITMPIVWGTGIEEDLGLPDPIMNLGNSSSKPYHAVMVSKSIRRKLWQDVLEYGKTHQEKCKMREKFLDRDGAEVAICRGEGDPPSYHEITSAVASYTDLRSMELGAEVRRLRERIVVNGIDHHCVNAEQLQAAATQAEP